MKDDDEEKKRPQLKSIEDYDHPDEEGKVVDFQERKKEKQKDGPGLVTKFCFKHEDMIVNFKAFNCNEDGIHIAFSGVKYMTGLPMLGEGWVEIPMVNEHVAPSFIQKVLSKVGIKYDLTDNVEKAALKLQMEVKQKLGMDSDEDEEPKKGTAEYIIDKFSL